MRAGARLNRFAELLNALPNQVTLDSELPVIRDGAVAPFNGLQQRLNRRSPEAKMLRAYPAAVRLYALPCKGGDDLHDLPFVECRRRLETGFGEAAQPVRALPTRNCIVSTSGCATIRSTRAGAGAGDRVR